MKIICMYFEKKIVFQGHIFLLKTDIYLVAIEKYF